MKTAWERTLGWERTPVDWFISVAFKKPKSGHLIWIDSRDKDPTLASKMAREYMDIAYSDEGYQEYGQSETCYRRWEQFDEYITHDEYLEGLAHKDEWITNEPTP
jgi:hypothetical protein